MRVFIGLPPDLFEMDFFWLLLQLALQLTATLEVTSDIPSAIKLLSE